MFSAVLIGKGESYIRQIRQAAKVAETSVVDYGSVTDKTQHLSAIHSLPAECWPAAVQIMLDKAWSALDSGWRVENRLAKKADLALIGEAKRVESKIGNQNAAKNNVINIDNDDLPKHNTQKDIAKTAGVSAGNVYKVEKILEQASPELLAAVRAGDVSINLASHHKLTLYLARNRPLLPRYRMQNEKGTPKRIAARVTPSARFDNFHIMKFD